MNQQSPTVAIFFGGKSTEHEISLKSATNIYHAIDTNKYVPALLGVNKENQFVVNPNYIKEKVDLENKDYFGEAQRVYLSKDENKVSAKSLSDGTVLLEFDYAFPIIHGNFGEDGTLQGILKQLSVAFVGPDIMASAIGMDKDITKRLLKDAGIPVARGITLFSHNKNAVTFTSATLQLGLPIFVKPANAGSSVGVSKVETESEFEQAINLAFQYDSKILIEEAVLGKEVECAILGNEHPKASVVGEIVPTVDFYSYEAKYVSSTAAELKIPAEIDPTVSDTIREMAISGFKAIGAEGLSRVDFLLRPDNTFVLNEINTLPGFTSISMYPKMWEASGISYQDLVSELIDLAIARKERQLKLQSLK